MLVRMLGNRFKKIESVIRENDPCRIVIKNIGDLFRIYDNIERDESFLDDKLVYYDLAFFKGNRQRYKEANESRDIFYVWKRNKEDNTAAADSCEEHSEPVVENHFVGQKTNKGVSEGGNDYKSDIGVKPDAGAACPETPVVTNIKQESCSGVCNQPASDGEKQFVIPESVFEAGKRSLNRQACGSFD